MKTSKIFKIAMIGIIAITSFGFSFANSLGEEAADTNQKVYKSINRQIKDQIFYPGNPDAFKQNGKVNVSFVVDSEGKVLIQKINGKNDDLNESVERMFAKIQINTSVENQNQLFHVSIVFVP